MSTFSRAGITTFLSSSLDRRRPLMNTSLMSTKPRLRRLWQFDKRFTRFFSVTLTPLNVKDVRRGANTRQFLFEKLREAFCIHTLEKAYKNIHEKLPANTFETYYNMDHSVVLTVVTNVLLYIRTWDNFFIKWLPRITQRRSFMRFGCHSIYV